MKQQFITRPKKYEKEEPSKEAKKVYIFCEGHKEKEYFDFFKNLNVTNLEIESIPPHNNQSAPTKLKENADDLFFSKGAKYNLDPEYKDEVWFVIDTDRWRNGISSLRNYATQKSTTDNKWQVVQSNPSFEIWLYYHFYNVKPLEQEVKKFKLKTFVNNKITGGFDNGKHPKFLEQAIQNAEKNHSEDDNSHQPDLYCTQVFHLGKSILPFVKDKL